MRINGPRHQAAPAHELQDLRTYQPHSFAPSREVIARNVSSSVARAGSSRETRDARGDERAIHVRGAEPVAEREPERRDAVVLDARDARLASEHLARARLVVDLDEQRRLAGRGDLADGALQRRRGPGRRSRRSRMSSRPRRAGARRGTPCGPRRRSADQPAHLEDAGRVEAVHRLVEDQQGGVGDQAPRDPEPLPHAERVRLDAVVCALGEPDALERVRDARRGRAVARRGDDRQVLASGQVGVEARLLDDRADARERVRTLGRLRQSKQRDLAGGRVRQPEQRADQGRLAGAVRAEEAEGDAGGDRQVDAVDGDAVAELLGQPARLDDRVHGRNLRRTGATSGKYGGASRNPIRSAPRPRAISSAAPSPCTGT